MQKTWVRVCVDIIVGITVVTLPWYISSLALIALTIYFPVYIEGLFFAFLFDTLYTRYYTFPYTALTVTTVFLLCTYFIKTRIRN